MPRLASLSKTATSKPPTAPSSSTATGLPPAPAAAGRRGRSCSSTAATSIPAASSIWSTSSTCPISRCSPGTPAATAARPATAAFRRASPPRCATSTPSCATFRPNTASPWKTSRWSRKAWARCWPPPGRTTTHRQIRCQVLASPAFKVKLYVPLARPGLGLMQKLFGQFYVNSYVKARFLTHDPERVEIVRNGSADRPGDRLAHPARALRDLRAGGGRRPGDRGADPAADLGRRLRGPPRAAGRVFPEPRRAGQGTDRAAGLFPRHLGRKRPPPGDRPGPRLPPAQFRRRPASIATCSPPTATASPRWSSKCSAKPLPWWTPKGLFYRLSRINLPLTSRAFEGPASWARKPATTRAAPSTTSTSNKPQGFPLIGTLIDKVYLESIGWRGIQGAQATRRGP